MREVSTGMGNRSTSGAQTNLKEYPRAAQLKYVTTERSTPASRNHSDSDEKINRIGTPAENPKNSMVITRGWRKARRVSIKFHFSTVKSTIGMPVQHQCSNLLQKL